MRQQESAALQYDTQFLQALSNVSKLPCCLWFGTSVWTSVQPHPCHTDGKWRETLEQGCAAEHPSIYFEDGIIFWGIFKLWKYYIAIGPAAYVSSDEEHRRSYAKKHNLPKDFTIQKASFGEMVQCLSLLTCHFWGSPTCDDQVMITGVGAEQTRWHTEGEMAEYQIAQSEYDRSHKSGIIFSDRIVEVVKAGEPEKIKQLMNGVVPDLYENAQVADDEGKQILEYIICYAQETWDCQVVFFTESRYDSEEYRAMVDQLLKLKDKWGIGVLDLWSSDTFNDISDEQRDVYMYDNIHPTKAGYRDWWGPEQERKLLAFLGQ